VTKHNEQIIYPIFVTRLVNTLSLGKNDIITEIPLSLRPVQVSQVVGFEQQILLLFGRDCKKPDPADNPGLLGYQYRQPKRQAVPNQVNLIQINRKYFSNNMKNFK
jgi:hypothetical protein